jgi:hypothetical protein
MSCELNHSCLALPSVLALKRKHGNVEVWDNPPENSEPPHIVVTFPVGDGWESVDLLPSEARAFAALLLNAAAQQDDRARATERAIAERVA